MGHTSIAEAIRRYADAYSALEALQDGQVLQIGDQKTGVIGEYYAKLFVESVEPDACVEYAKPNQPFDLAVHKGRAERRIQVKTVSDHSRTSRVSPIHEGYDQLYLLRVDRGLKPTGFWILTNIGQALHCTMPRRGVARSGSSRFRGAQDRLEQLLSILQGQV